MTKSGILWLVLDQASQTALRQQVPPQFKANKFYHHRTLRYGITRSEYSTLIGQARSITVQAIAWNNEAQAVRIAPDDLPDEYDVPHVTISTAEGIAPYASVAMLQGNHQEKPLSMTLSGTIEFELLSNL